MTPIIKMFEFIKVIKKLTKYVKNGILMVSSILRTTSQVELTQKYNSINSESKSVKQNTDHQNCLTVFF